MQLETLESRRMMSASLNGSTHLLTITGTGNDDVIAVSLNANGSRVVVNQNGVVQSFLKSAVHRIKALGNAGNDSITVAQSITIPAELHGGPGGANYWAGDTLNGGGGPDRLYANGTHNTTMRGGAGNDTLNVATYGVAWGGPGNDTFNMNGTDAGAFGEAGNDRFVMNVLSANFIEGNGGQDGADFSAHGQDLQIGSAAALTANGLSPYSGAYGIGAFQDGTRINDEIEVLKGGSGDDTMFGGAAENQLWGQGGDDNLDGGAGADALFGGNGNDVLTGLGGGSDFLSGGQGFDAADWDFADTLNSIEQPVFP